MRWLRIGQAVGVVALSMLVGIGTGTAATEKEPNSIRKVLELLGGKNRLSPADRISLAGNLRESCSQINQKIPSVSPKELEWINRELGSRNFQRMDRIGATPEYASMRIKIWLEKCVTYSNPASIDDNTYGWALLLLALMGEDIDYYTRKLSSSGILTEKEAAGLRFIHRYSDGILRNIMMDHPYTFSGTFLTSTQKTPQHGH